MRASIEDAVRLVRIAFRIHLLPAPRVFTHFLDAALSRPAEKLPGKLRVGPVGGFIARFQYQNDKAEALSPRQI